MSLSQFVIISVLPFSYFHIQILISTCIASPKYVLALYLYLSDLVPVDFLLSVYFILSSPLLPPPQSRFISLARQRHFKMFLLSWSLAVLIGFNYLLGKYFPRPITFDPYCPDWAHAPVTLAAVLSVFGLPVPACWRQLRGVMILSCYAQCWLFSLN